MIKQLRIFAILALGLFVTACASETLYLQSNGGVGVAADAIQQRGAAGQYSGSFAHVPRGEGRWAEYYEGDETHTTTDERIAVDVTEDYASTCVAFIARSSASWSLFGVQGTHIAATANAAPGTCETVAERVGNGAGFSSDPAASQAP